MQEREREREENRCCVSSNVRACREKNVYTCLTIEEGRVGEGESARIRSVERNWFGRVSRLKSRRVLGSVYTWAEN